VLTLTKIALQEYGRLTFGLAIAMMDKVLFRVVLFFLGLVVFLACKGKQPEPPPVVEQVRYLSFDEVTANQLDVKAIGQHQYEIRTTGTDPYILLSPLTHQRGERDLVLSLEYKATSPLHHLQVFLGAPINEERSLKTAEIAASSSWKMLAIDLGDQIKEFNWGNVGDFLRLDFGNEQNVAVHIRNLRLRKRNEAEEKSARERELFRQDDEALNQEIMAYLNRTYPASIVDVSVEGETIAIRGVAPAGEPVMLAEVTPYQQLNRITKFTYTYSLEGSQFVLSLARYVERDGFRYDRALSAWAVIREGSTKDDLLSHARYATQIEAQWNLPVQSLAHKKGLGGFSANRGFVEDLDDLPIGSVTVNVPITSFIYLDARPDTYVHEYGGKSFYFDRKKIDELDQTFRVAAARNIIVSAIILVQKASECADPSVGELLEHEHYTDDAFFTMPRLDNAESLRCYAAALDFLAGRYCQPGSPYGRIHHWIMHNEVDAGSTWTNMGKGRPLFVYLDNYYKSMRVCYNIAKAYDAHTEVLASFTHSWVTKAPGGDYATLDMINGLLQYSTAEGDFRWGLAYHPYPEDLNEPKTWNDSQATFSPRSPLVTFKNLEVLDDWIKRPENWYMKTNKRMLWLSENGTNSRTYEEKDLQEQAAGLAYAWKKLARLDGIDAIQWHNWIDNRNEFGLRIGLRRFPDDEEDPGGRKPVWHVYQAAGTEREDEIFEPYKAIIGINDWREIMKEIP